MRPPLFANTGDAPGPGPQAFVVWHRAAGKGQRWRVVGTVPDYRSALALVDRAGDWWLESVRGPDHAIEQHDSRPRQRSLFDEEPDFEAAAT